MGNHSTNPRTSKDTMKIYILLSVILVAQEAFGQVTVKPKAPSTFQNCDCQCNSDTWTDGNEIKGNCKGRDRNGALFCYVSGRALRACRDIQQSSFLPDNNGRLKYYSYEACTTPARNRCGQNNFQNPINQNLGFRFANNSTNTIWRTIWRSRSVWRSIWRTRRTVWGSIWRTRWTVWRTIWGFKQFQSKSSYW